MSTTPSNLSPLEQLAATSPQTAQSAQSNLSPLEQLAGMKPPTQAQTAPPSEQQIQQSVSASRAQTRGKALVTGPDGTPMFMDVPAGQEAATEHANSQGQVTGTEVGASTLALPMLYELALSHLAGDVLPGMEPMAAKAQLAQYAPKVMGAIKAMGFGSAGAIGYGALKSLWKVAMGSK